MVGEEIFSVVQVDSMGQAVRTALEAVLVHGMDVAGNGLLHHQDNRVYVDMG